MTLAATNLSFKYRQGRMVLRGVSVEVPEGITVIIGPNGAGKSTLLRLLLGLLEPAGGQVTLGGVPVHRLGGAARAARMAYISQRADVSAPLTTREVVALGRFAMARNDDAIAAAMNDARVLEFADQLFTTLSAGQQQRVSLARALAQLDALRTGGSTCRFLLADEPFSAMDPAHALHGAGLIRALRARGVRCILILHDLTLAARLGDHALVLDGQGNTAAFGPVEQSLCDGVLERVFGVRIERLTSTSGPAIVPAM